MRTSRGSTTRSRSPVISAHHVDLILVDGTVGLQALFTEDLDRAQVGFEEQLRLCSEHSVGPLAAQGLVGLAAIAARREQGERAARLLGAATATGPMGDPDVVRQLEEQFLAPARSGYGEERWDEAHAAGARLSFEQAIDLALSPAARGELSSVAGLRPPWCRASACHRTASPTAKGASPRHSPLDQWTFC